MSSKGRVSLKPAKQTKFKTLKGTVKKTDAPQELIEKVLQSDDLLSIVFSTILKYDMGLLLDVCTQVCKGWHKIIRSLDTPDKQLRAIPRAKLVEKPMSPGLCRKMRAILWDGCIETHTSSALDTARLCLENGGWSAREARRKQGDRIWEAGKMWSLPPGAADYRSHKRYAVTKEQFHVLKYGDEDARHCLWNVIKDQHEFDAYVIHVMMPGTRVCEIFFEVNIYGEWNANFGIYHPVIIRHPNRHLRFKTLEVFNEGTEQERWETVEHPPRPLDTKKIGMEPLES